MYKNCDEPALMYANFQLDTNLNIFSKFAYVLKDVSRITCCMYTTRYNKISLNIVPKRNKIYIHTFSNVMVYFM